MKKLSLLFISFLLLTLCSCAKEEIIGKYQLIGCSYKDTYDCFDNVEASIDIENDSKTTLIIKLKDKEESTSLGLLNKYNDTHYILNLKSINDEDCDIRLGAGYDADNDYIYLKMDDNTYYIFGK